jgi:hypothetical protein
VAVCQLLFATGSERNVRISVARIHTSMFSKISHIET